MTCTCGQDFADPKCGVCFSVVRVSKNRDLLRSFVDYCHRHPEERFWQALRNWCGWPFLYVSQDAPYANTVSVRDTFYWESRNGDPVQKTDAK